MGLPSRMRLVDHQGHQHQKELKSEVFAATSVSAGTTTKDGVLASIIEVTETVTEIEAVSVPSDTEIVNVLESNLFFGWGPR